MGNRDVEQFCSHSDPDRDRNEGFQRVERIVGQSAFLFLFLIAPILMFITAGRLIYATKTFDFIRTTCTTVSVEGPMRRHNGDMGDTYYCFYEVTVPESPGRTFGIRGLASQEQSLGRDAALSTLNFHHRSLMPDLELACPMQVRVAPWAEMGECYAKMRNDNVVEVTSKTEFSLRTQSIMSIVVGSILLWIGVLAYTGVVEVPR